MASSPIVVTTTADTASGPPVTGSLQWAIAQADAAGGAVTIEFELGTTPQTITLATFSPTLELTDTAGPVTITGPGASLLTINGNNDGVALKIDAGVSATVTGLTITDSTGGGDGAIEDLGSLTLGSSVFSANGAAGVYVAPSATATITGTTFIHNNNFSGGGLRVKGGTATLTDCTIEDNSSAFGGGLYNTGTVTLKDCTVTGNSNSGAMNYGQLTIDGGTVSSNSGGNAGGVINIKGTAYLDGATLDGNSSGGAGALYNSGQLTVYGATIAGDTGGNNGALQNQAGTATLTDCTISGASNYGNGGALGNVQGATLYVDDCTLESNTSTGTGGALYNTGTATLTDCTISGNTSGSQGGGVANGELQNDAVLTITASTLSGNSSGSDGGGLDNNGTATLTDCTIANNIAIKPPKGIGAKGGGLDNSGATTLVFCTITGNTTGTNGGGIYNGGLNIDELTLTDTIVAGNFLDTNGSNTPSDLVAGNDTTNDGSYNLIGEGSSVMPAGTGNIGNIVTPDLGPLANNGGPTETMAPLALSPAIGTGAPADGVTTDQRGEPLDIPTPDIGAYQIQRVVVDFSNLTSRTITYGAASVSLGGTLASGSEVPRGEIVSVTLDGVTQQATIGTGGGFSTTFDTANLPAAGSPWTVTYSYTTDGNYATTSGTSTVTVEPAQPTVTVTDAGGTYTGNEIYANILVVGVNGASGVGLEDVYPALNYYSGTYSTPSQLAGLTPMSAIPVAVGSYTAYADFPGSADYTSAWGIAVFSITPATPTVRVTDPGGRYGSNTAATATVAGVGGTPASTLEGVGLTIAYYSGTYTDPSQLAGLTPLPGPPTDIGSYTALASFPGSADYNPAAQVVSFHIVQTPPTISLSDPGGTYGGPPAVATATISSIDDPPGPGLEGVPLVVSYYSGTYTSTSQLDGLTPLAGPPTQAGAYTVAATFAGSTHYLPASQLVNFAIAPAAPVLSVSDAGGTYDGTSTFPAAATVAGIVAGVDDTPGPTLEGVPLALSYYSGTDSAAQLAGLTPLPGAPGGGGSYTVAATFPGSADYTAAIQLATFTIARATATVAVTDPGGTYSGSPFAASATVSGANGAGGPSLEGTTPSLKYYIGTYTDAAQLVGLTPMSSPPIHAGAYTAMAAFPGTADYTPASDIVDFAIARATPQLTWAPPASIVFGTALSAAQLDAKASVPGQLAYTPAPGTLLDAGPGQTLSATFTPADPTDYNASSLATTITVTPAVPTLSVSAPGGSFDGSPYPATVTIDGTGGASPAASLEDVAPTLTYYDGTGTSGTPLGPTPPSAPGTYTVVASFPGSVDYAATRSQPVTFTITQAPAPTLSLSLSGGSATFGQPVTFTVGVNGGPAAPDGTITFYDGTTPIGTVPLDASGTATLTIATLGVGPHAISASYSGDPDLPAATTSAAAESIAPAATQLVLVPQPVFKKKKVISLGLEARVVTTPGTDAPSGTVTFEILKKSKKKTSEQVLGTISLSGGSATLSVKPNQVLKKPITVLYSGGADFRSSTASTTLTSSSLKAMARAMLAFRHRGRA